MEEVRRRIVQPSSSVLINFFVFSRNAIDGDMVTAQSEMCSYCGEGMTDGMSACLVFVPPLFTYRDTLARSML